MYCSLSSPVFYFSDFANLVRGQIGGNERWGAVWRICGDGMCRSSAKITWVFFTYKYKNCCQCWADQFICSVRLDSISFVCVVFVGSKCRPCHRFTFIFAVWNSFPRQIYVHSKMHLGLRAIMLTVVISHFDCIGIKSTKSDCNCNIYLSARNSVKQSTSCYCVVYGKHSTVSRS